MTAKTDSEIDVEKLSSNPEPEATHLERPTIDLGNEAVLLDVTAGHIDGALLAGLKLAKDGHTVLIPQPSEDPNDPLNWSPFKKHMILVILGIAAGLGDLTSTLGIPPIILQGVKWNLSPSVVNYNNNLNVLMLAIGGLFWVPFVYFWGRAPVLFWTTLAGTLFSLGTVLTDDFDTYYALRALQGFCLSSVQGIGLNFIKDMFFFHEHARKIGIWAAIFLTGPYLGPPFGNFIIAGTGGYIGCLWLGFACCCVNLALIILFSDETWYKREVPIEDQPVRGQRLFRVVGIWQLTIQKGYFLSVPESFHRLFRVFLKPIIIPSMIYFGINIMWAVGINIGTSILFTVPKEAGGYGFGPNALGAICLTPAVGTILAEIWGHFFNDWLANRYIKKHEGVFDPEARLVTNYVAAALMVPGLVILGEALQHTLHYSAIIIGWGAYTAGTLAASVSLTAYLLDAYPIAAGEVNALLNFARAISGFSVGYFQVQWGAKVGYDGSFGTQAAIVGVSVSIIVILHIYGGRMRAKGGHI
ncbi:hypothetical protein Z517_00155 [Fonsecaea pedrosoi CBS 271.37]|uniref:Unplaced genomic scaffold supercont1.1, whole genome shotgun sequence n=1 Tax=Fonsecaea pedrosoi CBS 271.37 TaxID=1442368 RepID=A0A0D2FDS0_9EURO|nr:uncharacterized protein Z517_00155 [Fonsecaea pedrosoi CBS 271.37]KIW84767.1 hypothetical protein Z517_00155 [Fonsecaea pedrosoi CBS 271.37]